jgi:hypothetical protein
MAIPLYLVTNPKVPARTMPEFIAYLGKTRAR